MSALRQHPASLMAEVQQLAEGGWKVPSIRRLLARRGVAVSATTLYQWTSPEYSERCRRACADRASRRSAEQASFRLRSQTEEYRLAFIRRLAGEQVAVASIGRVCGVVFGEPLTKDQVRYALKVGRLPSAEREAA